MTRSDRLDAKDRRMVVALAMGSTQAQAAQAAGVSDRTVRRRLAEPAFMRTLEQEQRIYAGQLRRRVVVTALVAVDHLRQAMSDPNLDPRTRVAAAGRLIAAAAALMPAEVELEGRVTIDQVDTASAIEKAKAALQRVRENRADTTQEAINDALTGPTGPARLSNGNGHDPSSN